MRPRPLERRKKNAIEKLRKFLKSQVKQLNFQLVRPRERTRQIFELCSCSNISVNENLITALLLLSSATAGGDERNQDIVGV